jgi:hypothetical protein
MQQFLVRQLLLTGDFVIWKTVSGNMVREMGDITTVIQSAPLEAHSPPTR